MYNDRNTNGVLQGHITKNGVPVSGATVIFIPITGQTWYGTRKTITDSNGYYVFHCPEDMHGIVAAKIQVKYQDFTSSIHQTPLLKSPATFNLDIGKRLVFSYMTPSIHQLRYIRYDTYDYKSKKLPYPLVVKLIGENEGIIYINGETHHFSLNRFHPISSTYTLNLSDTEYMHVQLISWGNYISILYGNLGIDSHSDVVYWNPPKPNKNTTVRKYGTSFNPSKNHTPWIIIVMGIIVIYFIFKGKKG